MRSSEGGADADPVDARDAAIARLRGWGGDGLARDMAALFAEAVPVRLDEARRGLAKGDHAAVASAMHTLKASCAQLGGVEAAACCAAAERAALDGSAPESLARAVAEVGVACEAHVAWLARTLGPTADGSTERAPGPA
jgi:HPt (histidine-containing phosphotransfer) domain-containing protein